MCRSTTGEEVINRAALENRQAGRDREEIRLSELQDAVAQAVYNSSNSRWTPPPSLPDLVLCWFHLFL